MHTFAKHVGNKYEIKLPCILTADKSAMVELAKCILKLMALTTLVVLLIDSQSVLPVFKLDISCMLLINCCMDIGDCVLA